MSMSSNEEEIPSKTFAQEDLEAPKEDASVVLTADDSSVETSEEVTAEKTPTSRASHYGFVSLVLGIGFVALVVALNCPSKHGGHHPTVGLAQDGQDRKEIKQNHTIAPSDGKDEEGIVLPAALPFPDVVPIRAFSADVLLGYSTAEELKADLAIAAQHLLNRVILQNTYSDRYYSNNVWDSDNERPPRPDGLQSEEQEAPEVVSQVAQEAAQSASVASASYSKTNNQEQGVDEADIVKNDDTYVYASFGDYLVVWDRKGNQITQIQMPSLYGDDESESWGWAPPTLVNGILLTPNRVAVLVDAPSEKDAESLYSQQGTQVRIYSKPTTDMPKMDLLETKNFSGRYRDGRWMEESQSLHLVMTGNINAFPHLIQPLQRHRFDAELTSEEYMQAATLLATETLIPQFVKGLASSFLANGAAPENMVQINAWSNQPIASKTVDEVLAEGYHEHIYSSDEPYSSFIQIIAWNPEEEEDATPTSSLVLAPSSEALFYATESHWVMAKVSYRFNEESQQTDETLCLVHIQDGKFHSAATLSGHVSSPYSIDIQGNDLRVATTLQKWFPVDLVRPLCGDRDLLYNQDNCVNSVNWNQCFDLAIDGCSQIVKTGCPYEYTCAEPASQETSSTDNNVIVLDISTPGTMVERGRVRIGDPHEVITAVRFGEAFSYAMTFDQRDPFYVLKLEPGQAPKVAGSLKLDGFGRYLHPLNEAATLLVGIGQNATGTGMDQMFTGVMITVFDVSDPTQPVIVASHMLENDEFIESFSHAEWDPKAVQYANGKLVIPVTMYHHLWHNVGEDELWFEGEANMDDFADEEEEHGSVGSRTETEEEREDFEGFFVLTVGYTGIQEAFRVNHVSFEPICRYCHGGLMASRSILFEDGSLMTMSGENVQSHNIFTGQKLWNMTVGLEGAPKDCCW